MNKYIKYEVCCGCAEDVINAAKGGADRVELNSALFLGGLTPTIGAIKRALETTNIEIMAMVRSREGGFCYDKADIDAMRIDAKELLKAGASGLVFGFLNGDATLNVELTAEFVNICGEKEAVFHRAIDLCPNLTETAQQLVQLGIKRILTSGGKPTVIEGTEKIKAMLKAVGDKCEILPGGGININNAKEILEKTGATQLHSSARGLRYDGSAASAPQIFFGGKIAGEFLPETQYKVTDVEMVRAMRRHLNTLSEEQK